MDSKQHAKSGSVKLLMPAAGGYLQLSDRSLKVITPKLNGSPAANAVDAAMKNGTLIKAVAYVDKVTGQLKMMPFTN